MTLSALIVLSVAQLGFATLLILFIFVHRRTVERRARLRAAGLRELDAPLREWLVGAGDLAAVVRVFDGLSPVAARHAATHVTRYVIPPEYALQLAATVRDRSWVRAGLDDLTSPWWWRRLEGTRLLAELGTSGDVDRVRRLLQDEHPAVRIAATSCLRRIADASLIDVVLEGLVRQPRIVRSFQLGMLRERWALTAAALLPRLDPASPPHALADWINVAEVLETPDVLARAVELHSHEDASVRIALARALKKYFHADGARALSLLLADPDWRVRAQAARSLGVLHDAAAVPMLAERLADPAWWVRFRSSLALSQLGEPGRAALKAGRDAPDRFAANMASMVIGLSEGSVVELVEG